MLENPCCVACDWREYLGVLLADARLNYRSVKVGGKTPGILAEKILDRQLRKLSLHFSNFSGVNSLPIRLISTLETSNSTARSRLHCIYDLILPLLVGMAMDGSTRSFRALQAHHPYSQLYISIIGFSDIIGNLLPHPELWPRSYAIPSQGAGPATFSFVPTYPARAVCCISRVNFVDKFNWTRWINMSSACTREIQQLDKQEIVVETV